MGRRIGRHKSFRRDKCIVEWKKGLSRAGLPEPTLQELRTYESGFNMGWREHEDETNGYWRTEKNKKKKLEYETLEHGLKHIYDKL